MHGDPNQETARLMPPLYATAYAVRKIYKNQGLPFKVEKLRGRWPGAIIDQEKSDWSGFYGLPVPNTVETLLPVKAEKLLPDTPVTLETWHYGTVAQILHIGSYSQEYATVQKLLEFIKAKGYCAIADSHEEIYLSDPQKTAAEKLKTIILYRLEAI